MKTQTQSNCVNGLKVGVDAIRQDEVVMISVACLVVLFSLQKYGTSKFGLDVGPALGSVLLRVMVYTILSNMTAAFLGLLILFTSIISLQGIQLKHGILLGRGCLLCPTDHEAMFADLCYFSVRSVQITFLFLVLPCLLLGYLGQVAYLMEHHADAALEFNANLGCLVSKLNKEHDGFQLVDANADDLLLQIVAQPSNAIQGSVWLDTLPTEVHMDFFFDKVGFLMVLA
ncbi:putative potassium transporter [Medicago truncatula]|uniref:Potassium transporter-like protein n=1 Tax=Medicago truncatula TaxID=3880 RepID=A0A072UJV1_MEDTR|nr:potassium transporter-like protein [Medicago truncatula]RHN51361.1 putative potassium transporter [Medicago truncatula]